MTLKSIPTTLGLAIALSLVLSACSQQDGATDSPATSAGGADTAFIAPNLSDGPDTCFRAIAEHLGVETKVSEISSFFSAGSEIEPRDSKPQGEMTTCSVKYQNPEDPRKLLSANMDLSTGTFGQAKPLEITVTGNAADFDLEDYLIPLSQIDAAALADIMESQTSALADVYSAYAWNGVRLSAPGPFSDVHTLRLDVKGRLASNDVQNSGYASVSVDGKAIASNRLLP